MSVQEIHKPKCDVYKDIIRITQSMLYTPESFDWFCETFPAIYEQDIEEALLYLCHMHYLYETEEGTYAVDRDFRITLKGIYHSDGLNGHVHTDSIHKIYKSVFIPDKWKMGANHNDRVEFAIEGCLEDYSGNTYGKINGAVQRIVDTWGDYFIGRIFKINEKWGVIPEYKEIADFVELSEIPVNPVSGTVVFAKFSNADEVRYYHEKTSDIRQKEKTISWNTICGADDSLKNNENIIHTCAIVKYIKTEEERLLYRYGMFSEFSQEAKCEFDIIKRQPGKPRTRKNLTTMDPAKLLSNECAVHVTKRKSGYKVMMHVADVSELFKPGTALEKELLRKCYSEQLVPDSWVEQTGFLNETVRNAITVAFNVNKDCEISDVEIFSSAVFTKKTDNYEYDELVKLLPSDGISSNPIVCLANDAVAKWLDENDFTAPFVHVFFSPQSELLFEIANELNWADDKTVSSANMWRTVKKANKIGKLKGADALLKLAVCTETNIIPGSNMTSDFCRPFKSYVSLLTQYCIKKGKAARDSKDKNGILKFVSERLSQYNYRKISLENYLKAIYNLEISKKLLKGGMYKGKYILTTAEGESLFFVNDAFGIVKDTVLKNPGETVALIYEDISIDGLNLVYKIAE